MPIDGTPGDIPLFEGFDKLVHTGFFFVLTVFLFYGKIKQQGSFRFRIITIIKILFITAALGAGIEMLQWKVFTYRTADVWDFFTDMTGVCIGVFSYIFLHRTGNEKFS